MKTSSKLGLLFILFFSSCLQTSVLAQSAAQTVTEAANSINQKIDEMHQLAERKKVYAAIDKLDEVNKEINKEVTWGTFNEKYKEAKLQNPGFTFSIRGDLPAQLEPSFWAEYESRCDKIMASRKEATDGIVAMVQLNAWDKVMAYGSQLKTMYEAFTGAAENLGTANLPKFAYDLYGNMNDFIDNYKKIEQAELEGLEIETFKAQVNLMVSKARKSQELYNEYKRYIKSNRMVIDDFKANINYINKLKGDASSGPLAKLSYADNNYNWNYGPFQKEVQEACSEFAVYDIKCPDFKKNFEEINQNARQDWTRVQENIFASDDAEKKGEFLKYHDDRWTEFLGVVNPIFNKTYNEFCLGKPETNNETPKPKKEPEVVVADDPFAGSSSSADAEPSKESEKKKTEPEPKKKPPVNDKKVIPTGNSNYTSSDKYWENTIPANATKEWVLDNKNIVVRYQVKGRTVGYRTFSGYNLNDCRYETVTDNIAVRHGPYRGFGTVKKTGRRYVSLSFYREDVRCGPSVSIFEDGQIDNLKYYIDGNELPEAEYRRKAAADKSLAPPDIYKQQGWINSPTESNLPNSPQFLNDNLSYGEIGIPPEAIKFIRVGIKKINEFYFLDNNLSEPVGEREWSISGGKPVLRFEEVRYGRKGYYRRWSVETGELNYFRFYDWEKVINGKKLNELSVGPYLKDGTIAYTSKSGEKISKEDYAAERSRYPELPSADLIQSLSQRPSVQPNTHGDPDWVGQDVSKMNIPPGAKIWRISINKSSYEGAVIVKYAKDNQIVSSNSWFDTELTQPSSKVVRSHRKQILYVRWYKNGNLREVHVNGRIDTWGMRHDFNEDGSLKKFSNMGYSGSSVDKGRLAYQGYSNIPGENDYLTLEMKGNMKLAPIPETEMTAIFKKVWNNENISTGPGQDVLVQENNPPSVPDDTETESNEEANYEQLQKQEFFQLAGQINKKISLSDDAFNKPYWEESQGPRATDNPKQESLDLMRQAVQIAGRAIYPENKGALSFLIAYKLIDYSGRVFGYEAKQDFFLLAAEQVIKADQVLTKNKYMKQDISEAYCMSGEVWMEMTRKAQWGNHAFNKMACDKMVIQQYKRAVQADPNNLKARKILEQLKTPKKPVPPAVEKFEKIPDESWNTAQTLREQMEKEILEEKVEENYLEVADMTLDINKGTVSIKRSGGKDWKKITESTIVIFPNDRIKTSEDAEGVSVVYNNDKTFLAIKPGSEVLFQDEQLMIWRGGVSMRVIKQGNKFMVITPTYAVGVRGTEFEVNVGADKSTETYLYEGVVEIRNGTDVGYLVPGQKLTAKKDQEKFMQTDFDVAARKSSTEWIDLDAEKRKFDRAKANTPVVIPSQNPSSNNNPHKGGNSQPSGGNSSPKYSSPADVWRIQTYSNDLQNFKQEVTTNTNNGFVPVGINCSANQFELLYLGGGILNISEWNMEWYNDANALQQGITNNMNLGYIPTGFSWSGSQYYVFYVKTDFTGQAWQIVPAPQDLTAVSNAIQPWLEQNYTPMGISLFGDEYYTLLVQFVEPLAAKWQIEGYKDNTWEISNGINTKLPEGIVPWGMLKSSGIANILYIGY